MPCAGNVVSKLKSGAHSIAGHSLTPAQPFGSLAGPVRADLLARGLIAEAGLLPADLGRAQDVAFFNSVRGWLRAKLLQT